ncbi:MAG: hypothetical protein JWN45_2867 [Acidobacteriaceae bacterium]|nr:hypothetical protein [Acidobacteriaceae bacterium]
MKTTRTLFLVSSLLLASIAFAQTTAKSGTTKTKAHSAAQKVDNMMDSFQIMEKGLWEAWKNRDAKPFDQHLTVDALTIDNGGLSDRATILKNITGCDVKNYSLDDFKLTKVDADAALLTYKATGVDASCDGQKIPENILASTLFKKSGGTWRMLFHQETAMPATSAAKE